MYVYEDFEYFEYCFLKREENDDNDTLSLEEVEVSFRVLNLKIN